jgi:hypothetical protein
MLRLGCKPSHVNQLKMANNMLRLGCKPSHVNQLKMASRFVSPLSLLKAIACLVVVFDHRG